MKKATTLVMTALLLAGCGAPAYVMEGDVYAGLPPVSIGAHDVGGHDGDRPERPSAAPERPAPAQPDTSKKVVSLNTNATTIQLLPQRSQTLRGTVTYSDGTRDSNMEWSSSDQTVVTVNSTTGEVTGIRPGNATIQGRAGADLHRFINIPVMVREGTVEDVVATVVAARDTIAVGDTLQLEAQLQNSASQSHLNGRWTSSNQQVAYVNEHGLVTGRRPGQVTITFASDTKSSVKGRVTLTVEDPTP